jgi:GNAT superfamily N-acetyltransferase
MAGSGAQEPIDGADLPAGEADRTVAIEAAFERYWRHFGLYPGASLRDEDGVLWFESPIRHLPYNWVIRTQIPADADADAVITRVAATFRSRDVPFMWIQRPSDRPVDLGQRLAVQGLDLVEDATGMDLDLDDWQPDPRTSRVEMRVVDAPGTERGLRDYEELIRTNWSVPEEERHLIETLNRYWIAERNPGLRLVAYLDGQPVGKAFANLEDVAAWVAIYGVAVRPEARGQGVATALMNEAIVRGKAAGARRAVLHSSSMALSMYRRMGFVDRCRLPVFASAAMFGTHHH